MVANISVVENATQYFEKLLANDPQKSTGLAAIETLLAKLKESKAVGVHDLTVELTTTISALLSTDKSAASIKSATELFLRFISLTKDESKNDDFSELMKIYKKRGSQLINRICQSRSIISKFALPFIQHNSKLLVHAYSKSVLAALLEAQKAGHIFQVYVTESAPDFAGRKMHASLKEHHIDSTLILDSCVGYLMERVDAVLLGAESVLENGGIINKIGTFGIAIAAKAMNKNVYVVAESIKFVKEFPMTQSDIPDKFKYRASTIVKNLPLDQEHPIVDYTPPSYINLLITDLGIYTTSTICDELIKLHS